MNPSVTSPFPEASGAGATASLPHPRAIRSFVVRAGRTTVGQSRALETLGPRFVLPYQASQTALAALYPQLAAPEIGTGTDASVAPASASAFSPLVLEIGFGMGEATAQIAASMPGTNFLCCEVHTPGVGSLLKHIGEQGLSNVHIIAHDAVEVIDRMLPRWSASEPARGLDGVHVFFPDPWHKKRHNKRRLLQGALVGRLAALLKPGGYIHCATDWQPYAEQMLLVLGNEVLLCNPAATAHPELGGYAPRPHYRPLTKFEKRGIGLGHGVWDLVFQRV